MSALSNVLYAQKHLKMKYMIYKKNVGKQKGSD